MSGAIYERGFRLHKHRGKLRVQPRTLKDLESQDVFEQVGDRAKSLESEIKSLKREILSFDKGPDDYNKKPGEVLLREVKHKGRTLTGHFFEDQLRIDVQDDRGLTHYSQDGDRLKRLSTPKGSEETVEETLRINGESRNFYIEGPADRIPFSDFHYGYSGFADTTEKELSWSNTHLQRQDGEKFGANPRTLTDLSKIEKEQHMYDKGNEATNRVKGLFDAVSQIDQSRDDRNPRKDEVLFRDFEFQGKTFEGSILPGGSLRGFDRWGDPGGRGKYMRAQSTDGLERLELYSGKAYNTEKISSRLSTPSSDDSQLIAYENQDYRTEAYLRENYGEVAFYERKAAPESTQAPEKSSGWFDWNS